MLDLETEVGKQVRALEDFVTKRQVGKNLARRFWEIQLNNSVELSQYAAIELELKTISKELKEFRLSVIDKGGKFIPDSEKLFSNHQPQALIGEIRSYLEYRSEHKNQDKSFSTGFVVHYNRKAPANEPNNEKFHTLIATGSKVLYTLDVDDILSIGDPRSTKHSVVAVGKDCKAAGIAQLAIDSKTDMYFSMEDHTRKAANFRRMLQDKQDPSVEENAKYYEAEAKKLKDVLQGWTPPPIETRIIELDFDSGHYAPSKAWKPAMEAWSAIGYTPRWSREAKHV